MPKKIPPIPAAEKLQYRKNLSAPSLLEQVRKTFEPIADHRKGKLSYTLPDILMSALAVLGLKYPSLLQFDNNRHENTIKNNLKQLYGVKDAPCDTPMRMRLDPVEPTELRAAFIEIHHKIQRDKILDAYKYLGGYLASVDATGQLSSSDISCQECCSRRLRNGSTQYYHQVLAAAIVHPDKSNVLPLFPEAITRQDGKTKNDCETNAAKRLFPAIRNAFPKLKLIVVEDSLYANGPHIKLLEKLSMSYIIVVKPAEHSHLMTIVEPRLVAKEGDEFETIEPDSTIRAYRFINKVPLNASHPDLLVNYLEYTETKGDNQYHISWVTNINLYQDNVFAVMRGGRARWKIENETFNTLKNQGYHLEHNYGHGKQYLATVLATLMFLHFLIDQVQELACPLFKAARHRFYSKIQFWEILRGRFLSHLIPNWITLWKSIIYGLKAEVIQFDTS
jgi:hypothetical protein